MTWKQRKENPAIFPARKQKGNPQSLNPMAKINSKRSIQSSRDKLSLSMSSRGIKPSRIFYLLLAVLFILCLPMLIKPAGASITFFGQGHNPATSATDGGTCNDSGTPTAITPPGSMAANDYVILIALAPDGNASNALGIVANGGQTWTAVTQVDKNDVGTTYQLHGRLWHARFNGTWGANPSVSCTTASGDAFVIEMLVFRGVDTTTALDVSPTCASFDGSGSNFNITVGAITTSSNNSLALAFWLTYGDTTNSTMTLQTGGWSQQQSEWRTTNNINAVVSHAYKTQVSAGSTGSVTNQENGGLDGITCILALKAAAGGGSARRAAPIIFE